MFPYEMDFKVIEEQRQSKLKRAARKQFIKTLAETTLPRQTRLQRLAYWLGKQMILWGRRLQSLSPVNASDAAGYRLNPSLHTTENTTLANKYRS